MKRLISSLIFFLLVASVFMSLRVQPAKAVGTIYIRADGSIDPPTAPIISSDNVTYTFTGNINGSIVVERDDILLDGANHSILGDEIHDEMEKGIDLSHRSNVTLKNTKILYCTWGIWLNDSHGNSIQYNEVFSNHCGGIVFHSSNDNLINDNDVTRNPSDSAYWFGSGIEIADSQGNRILRNNISQGHGSGIELSRSYSNELAQNIIYDKRDGILSSYSDSNILLDNNVSCATRRGILLSESGNNTLVGNVMSNNTCNFWLYGSDFEHLDNHIDTSNTVDGKPIYYLVNATDAICGSETDAGVVCLVNCRNMTVRDLTLTGNFFGVFLWNTTNSVIQNVTTQGNLVDGEGGVKLVESNNNTLIANTVSNHRSYGIRLENSSNNTITNNLVSDSAVGVYLYRGSDVLCNVLFHNNFIDNALQAGVYLVKHVWDDGYASGGNYWSDYNGSDADFDGVGDTPYLIDEDNQDNYPLMILWGGIFGDVNGDGFVGIDDVFLVASHFSKEVGDSGYSRTYDLNGDGYVGIDDIFHTALHFGEEEP